MHKHSFSAGILFATLAACGSPEDTVPGPGHDRPLPGTGLPDGADPASAYTERGALGVGYTVLEADDDLVVKAWYPAEASGSESITYEVVVKLDGFGDTPVPFLGNAARDAAPDTDHGPYPLVVLSHGFGMNPEWYHPLAEHLASHGFVVLGPEHLEADWFTDVLASTTERPADVSATIDLAEDGVLDGIIDTDHAAVVGHSYGGYTALAAAGARFDFGALAEHCAEVTDEFSHAFFCDSFLGYEQVLADALELDGVPEGLWPSLADRRVDAIVPMAGDAFLFGVDGLAEVTVPAMMLGGTGDTAAPWEQGTGLAWEAVGSETRALVAFEGAEHFIPVTTCEHMPWTAGLPEEYLYYFCEDPAWDKDEALVLINQLTTAFLRHTLADDARARASLQPGLYAGVEGLEVQVALGE